MLNGMKSKSSNRPNETKGASAILAHDRLIGPKQLDNGDMLRTLVRRFQQRKKAVTVNFRRLLPALNSADRFNHLIHPYPAKLLVHIPCFFLASDLLCEPGDMVLDPFCGSGTVLVEAQRANRRAYGADANPLARLITRVKTTPLEATAAKRTLSRIVKRIKCEPSGSLPDVVNLDHWFYPSTVRQLQCLREMIARVRDPAIRDFLFVCFSVCVRKVSLADPRLSVPVRLKFGQYPRKHPLRAKSDAHLRRLRRVSVAQIFKGIAEMNVMRMQKFTASAVRTVPAEVLCSDARNLVHEYSPNGDRNKPLTDKSVQLIITSPPYPGAQKYIRSCSLSLGWLDLCPTADLRACKARIIGREEFTNSECSRFLPTDITDADRVLAIIRKRNPMRATIAETYLHDMRNAFREMNRVLKPGGYIVIAVANNRISGKKFRTVDYLRTMAAECRLSMIAWFVDSIRSRGLMTKRNGNPAIINKESILIFAKGGLPRWARYHDR
jgi:DNA modification methylase